MNTARFVRTQSGQLDQPESRRIKQLQPLHEESQAGHISTKALVCSALILMLAAGVKICQPYFKHFNSIKESRSEILSQSRDILKGSVKGVFMPEYDKNLGKIVFSFEGSDEAQLEIIKKLPKYSEIIIFVQETKNIFGMTAQRKTIPEISKWLSTVLPEETMGRIRFLKANPDDVFGIYSRDMGIGTDSAFFVPFVRLEYGGNDKNPTNRFAYNLAEVGVRVVKHPTVVTGGNVYFARNVRGERIVFVGQNSITRTKDFFRQHMIYYSEGKIKEIIRKTFDADKVIAMHQGTKGDPVSNYLYHIDLAFAPLCDGKIALCQSVGGAANNDRAKSYSVLLEGYRRSLQDAGFEIIDIYTDASHIEKYQSYANLIVFTDRDSGKKTVLLPIYPDEKGEYSLTGLNKANIEVLVGHGFKVIPINEKAFGGSGNSRCLINQISYKEFDEYPPV